MATLSIRVSSRFCRLIEGTTRLASSGRQRWVMPIGTSTSYRGLSAIVSEETSQNIPDPTASTETESTKKLKSELEKLNKTITSLEEKNQELDDKYKRALAEGENMRRRLMKQVDDAKLYGIQGFCKDLLEVSDILRRATESVPQNELSESNPHLKNLYEGLSMIEAQLQQVFKRHGLVPVNPVDEKFDPNLHEALFQQETREKEPGTVVVVSKIGYKLHDRVVRPALVGVAKST